MDVSMAKNLLFPTSILLLLLLQAATTCSAFLPLESFIISSRSENSHSRPRTNDDLLRLFAAFPSKTIDEEKFIEDSLLRMPVFNSLAKPSLLALVDAFEKIKAASGDAIVEQGDSCERDYVYLVAEGECTVTVDGNVVPEPYGSLQPKAVFGELGVLYNERRAATVSAKSDSVTMFRIQGATFKNILNKPTVDLENMQQIDEVINQIYGSRTLYCGDIIPQYQPERLWLWRQWSGTILNVSLQTTLLNMLVCLLFIVYAHEATSTPIWSLEILAPDKSLPFIQRLSLIHQVWGLQQALTTFVLTFFLNQAFNFWKDIYYLARKIQGSLNDFQLVLATNVKRQEDGTFTTESKQLVDDIGQYSRLFHALMWAGVTRRFAILKTPLGLERMSDRGLMTSRQLEVLQSLDVPNNELHNAPLQWMMIRANRAIQNGTLAGDNATKSQLLKQITELRATYTAISDKLAGRMPLAYAHLVQILVDTFVLIAPFALYADLGDYSVIAVGILTLFYTGLLDLAKIFLDPLNNENFSENSIFMDLGVLVRESNAGSTRWRNSGERLPF
jgi:predicted membrane chloride channel (bestrophin family)